MFRIILLMFLFFKFACFDSSYEIQGRLLGELPDAVQLEGKEIDTDSNGIYTMTMITFIDSNLVISSYTDGKMISIIDKNEKLYRSLGTYGRGPSEFNDAPFIYDQFLNKNTYVTNVDFNLLTMDVINLTKSVEYNTLNIDTTIEFPKSLRRIRSAHQIDKDRILGIYNGHYYQNLDKRTGIYDFNPITGDFRTQKLPNVYFEREDLLNDDYLSNISNLNIWFSDISPSKKYFVTSMMHIPTMNIYKVTDNKIIKTDSIYFEKERVKYSFKLKTYEEKLYPDYILDIVATDNSVYLLQNRNKTLSYEETETHVLVLDWEGKTKEFYRIPKKYDIDVIAVNEADSIFYGLSYSQDAIYKFDYSSAQ